MSSRASGETDGGVDNTARDQEHGTAGNPAESVPHDPCSANGSDARGPEAEEPDARLRGSRDDAPSEVREDDGVWAGRLRKGLPRDT